MWDPQSPMHRSHSFLPLQFTQDSAPWNDTALPCLVLVISWPMNALLSVNKPDSPRLCWLTHCSESHNISRRCLMVDHLTMSYVPLKICFFRCLDWLSPNNSLTQDLGAGGDPRGNGSKGVGKRDGGKVNRKLSWWDTKGVVSLDLCELYIALPRAVLWGWKLGQLSFCLPSHGWSCLWEL